MVACFALITSAMSAINHTVLFSDKSIANILSFNLVKQQYNISYNGMNEVFTIHYSRNGLWDLDFQAHSSRLHYYNIGAYGYAFIETMEEKKFGSPNVKSHRQREQKCSMHH